MHHYPIDLEAQSPSRTLSEASTIAPENASPESPPQSYWAIVVQSLDESAIMHHVAVNPGENGEQVWSRVREHLLTPSITTLMWNWLLALFTTTIVGTATILQLLDLQVSIQNFEQDWLLTKAFQRPHLLSQLLDHVAQNQRFCVNPSLDNDKTDQYNVLVIRRVIDKTKVAWLLIILLDHVAQNQRFCVNPSLDNDKTDQYNVLVIRRVIDKTKVAWLLIILLVLSPGLGLIVGLCTHKAEVGIAVSAGVFALAAFLQGLAAWFHS